MSWNYPSTRPGPMHPSIHRYIHRPFKKSHRFKQGKTGVLQWWPMASAPRGRSECRLPLVRVGHERGRREARPTGGLTQLRSRRWSLATAHQRRGGDMDSFIGFWRWQDGRVCWTFQQAHSTPSCPLQECILWEWVDWLKWLLADPLKSKVYFKQ